MNVMIHSLKKSSLYIVLSVSLAALAAILSGCNGGSAGLYSPQELEREIDRGIEPGAELQEIKTYLDSLYEQGIRDPVEEVTTAREADVVDRGLAPDTLVYTAYVRDSEKQLTLVFVLDGDLRYDRLILVEYYYGP